MTTSLDGGDDDDKEEYDEDEDEDGRTKTSSRATGMEAGTGVVCDFCWVACSCGRRLRVVDLDLVLGHFSRVSFLLL